MKTIDQSIFKAYDIRGIYPESINSEIAYAIGQGYAKVIAPVGKVVIGHDVRIHSEELKLAMIEGLTDAGIDVVDIGLISTEMIYFATGYYNYGGGIQVTASHNPAQWHGAKLVKAKAEPISSETGLFLIRDFVKTDQKIVVEKKGTVEKKDILEDFCRYVLAWIDATQVKPMKIVANPNFGYEGVVLNKIIELGKLPLEVVPLNFDPDGTFPKGRPDPFIIENRAETVEYVKKNEADLGVAWDADADRVFFCTGGGVFLEPYYTNTLIIKYMLAKKPRGKIIYDPRNTWALIDATKQSGGTAILERVGHSFIKARMRTDDAIFSGESSGHTYYKDFWYADSGIIPLLQIMEIVSKENKSLDQLLNPIITKYPISGEVNFTTVNAIAIMGELEKKYAKATVVKVDGLSLEFSDWRLNLRTSNTEPLLRLNMEAKSKEILDQKFAEITGFIKENL